MSEVNLTPLSQSSRPDDRGNCMSSEERIRDALLAAHEAGAFLHAVYQAAVSGKQDREAVPTVLVDLHNSGQVDVVAAFEQLQSVPDEKPNFFFTRHHFEKTLPHLNAPVPQVMRCVAHLFRAAGTDMAAGSILNCFVDFCTNEPNRPKEAIAATEADSSLRDLLLGALVAGSSLDSEFYFGEARRLAKSGDIELRKRALHAVGRLKWPTGQPPPELALATLEENVHQEANDQVLAGVIKAAFSLFEQNNAYSGRATALIGSALAKGEDYSLHAASEIFGFDTANVPMGMLDVLFVHLRRTKPVNNRTIHNIDYGISALLENGDAGRGIVLWEDLLLAHPEALTGQHFDNAIRSVCQSPALTNRVLTRWLLRGNKALCECARLIVEAAHDRPVHPEIDPAEIGQDSFVSARFLARKAIGFLILRPESIASLLVSLMRFTHSDETRDELANLLFDPVVLNYPGSARTYVEAQFASETGPAKEALGKVIDQAAEYESALNSIGRLPELHPSETQRQTYNRRQQRTMSESMKKAQSESVLLSMVSRSVLLYGRTSIHLLRGPDNTMHRTEIPLRSIGTEMELPRSLIIEPAEFDYMLRVFRNESWAK